MVKHGEGRFEPPVQPRLRKRFLGSSTRGHPSIPSIYTEYHRRLCVARTVGSLYKRDAGLFYRCFIPGKMPRSPSALGGGYIGRLHTPASDLRKRRWDAKMEQLGAISKQIRFHGSHVLGRGPDNARSRLLERRHQAHLASMQTRKGGPERCSLGYTENDMSRVCALLHARFLRGYPVTGGVTFSVVRTRLFMDLRERLGPIRIRLLEPTRSRTCACIEVLLGRSRSLCDLSMCPSLTNKALWPNPVAHPMFYNHIYLRLLLPLLPIGSVPVVTLVFIR